jgi:hypothetical protein
LPIDSDHLIAVAILIRVNAQVIWPHEGIALRKVTLDYSPPLPSSSAIRVMPVRPV